MNLTCSNIISVFVQYYEIIRADCCNGGGTKSLKGQYQQIFDLPMIVIGYVTDLNEQNW
jgi:hypothetical protein